MAVKRQVLVRLSIEVLAGFIRQGQVVDFEVMEGIPPDARLVEWWPEEGDRGKEIFMVFEHPSFKEVAQDEDPPEQNIVCRYYAKADGIEKEGIDGNSNQDG